MENDNDNDRTYSFTMGFVQVFDLAVGDVTLTDYHVGADKPKIRWSTVTNLRPFVGDDARKMVHITFDDGYHVRWQSGMPIPVKVPAPFHLKCTVVPVEAQSGQPSKVVN